MVKRPVSIGDRFTRLIVTAVEIRHNPAFRRYAICDCDCGTKGKAIRVDALYTGVSGSCGCLKRERVSQAIKAHPRPVRERGEKSAHWRGGRVLNYHGYILVYIGRDHPWANKQGYILEHRLVVARLLGRKLEPHEPVHHKDHNKQNNAPENLAYCGSTADHFVHHRKRDDLQLPNEPNPVITCACGCNATLEKYDSIGRPRRFLLNHSAKVAPAPVRSKVIELLRNGPKTRAELAAHTGQTLRQVTYTLYRMKKRGIARNTARGTWKYLG